MQSVADQTRKLLNRRILSLLTVGMFVALFDRINLSYAALQMNEDLSYGPEIFGAAVAAFFVGYALFELPSAYVLVRVGARKWLTIILVVWGLASASIAMISDPTLFYALRFLVGFAEAGYPASCAFVIAQWYLPEDRVRTMSKWMSGALFALAFAGPCSTFVMSFEGFGLRGWQWLFIAGGVPAVLLGWACWHNLAGGPTGAAWLPESSRQLLRSALDADIDGDAHQSHDFVAAIRSSTMWIFTLVYMLVQFGGMILVFWLPQIIKNELDTLTLQQIGFVGALPFLLAVGTNVLARHNTARTGDCRWHLILGLTLAAVCLSAAVQVPNRMFLLFAITLGICLFFTCVIILLGLPLLTVRGAAVASGIALINSGGQAGAGMGTYTMGLLEGHFGSYSAGIYVSSLAFLTAAALTFLFRRRFPSLRITRPAATAVAEPG